MTVRIHTESSKEAGCRVGRGGEKVQHSNNKMEGPSCIINHRNKQRMMHNECCAEKQRTELLCFSKRKLHHDHWNKLWCTDVSHVNLCAWEIKYNWCHLITCIPHHSTYSRVQHKISELIWNKHTNIRADAFHTCLCSVSLHSVQHVYTQCDGILTLLTVRWQLYSTFLFQGVC